MTTAFRIRGICVCAVLAFASVAQAGEYLVAANSLSRDLSIVRLSDYAVMAKVSVSNEGFVDDVVGTPDGQTLIANVEVEANRKDEFNDAGYIVAFETATGKKLWMTPMPGSPNHLTLTADGSQLFVPIYEQRYVLVLDVRTGSILGRAYGDVGMHVTKLSEDGRALYAGSTSTGAVYKFDVVSRELMTTYPFSLGEWGGIGVRPFAVTRDQKTIYAQLTGLHGFAVLDTPSGKIKLIRHPDLPRDFVYQTRDSYVVDHGLELSPDQKTLVMASESTQKAYIYSTDTLALRKTISVGHVAKWVVFSKSGTHAYISNTQDNSVSDISLQTLSEEKRFPTGGLGPVRIKIITIPDEIVTKLAAQ
jgi:DNA-binding beta-propeller fold protein YncE